MFLCDLGYRWLYRACHPLFENFLIYRILTGVQSIIKVAQWNISISDAMILNGLSFLHLAPAMVII
jgi:hypothetical protein